MNDTAGPGLSIVIPVYNSMTTIGPLVARLSELDVEGGLEIVLVNDGSSDDTHAVCVGLVASARAPVVYVEHMRNFGEHNAVMTGLRHACGDYVITMDDDFQNPPAEVARLYDHARQSDLDVVYTRYARKNHAAWRNAGSRFTNWVASLLMDKPAGLYLSTFRCMSAPIAAGVAAYCGPYPYIDGMILRITQRIGSLEVAHASRAGGKSNYTVRRLLRVWLNLATSFSVAPLRIAFAAGVLMAFAGAVGAVAVIVEALTSETPPGWASIAVVLLVVGGIQCMMLGVAGEYVGRTFLSAMGKPQAAVRSVRSNRDWAECRRGIRCGVISSP
jgi:glycosyltransferase involved in cell wall biosynthesis